MRSSRRFFLGSMARLGSMREPVRATAHLADGTVVWFTDAAPIGRRYPVNDELGDALKGQLVVHSDRLHAGNLNKEERVGLASQIGYFVESDSPILEPQTRRVRGVMALYKVPVQLSAAIREGLIQRWLACAASALGLFLARYWIVARADRVMRDQQARLAQAQILATAAELAGAVAHNLRNPLASVRLSAEMLASSQAPGQERVELCNDITLAVDRANRWITELVRVSQVPQLVSEVVWPSCVMRKCAQELTPEMTRRGIRCTPADDEAPAAHTAMLPQILVSLLANAIEAMPEGGELQLGWKEQGPNLQLHVLDIGTGLRGDARQALFRPFFSTKSGGLGIGLVLVERLVQQ